MLQRSERVLVGGRSSDLQTEPSLSLAACNPSHGERLSGGGRGGGKGRGRKRKGVSPASVKPIPGVQES